MKSPSNTFAHDDFALVRRKALPTRQAKVFLDAVCETLGQNGNAAMSR